MADTSTFVVASLDSTIPNARVLTAGKGFHIIDSGPSSPITITAGDHLDSVVALSADGIVSYTNSTKSFNSIALNSTSTISVNSPTGQGSLQLNVIPNTTTQNINISDGTTTIMTPQVNFAGGTGVSVGVSNISGKPTVTIASNGQSGAGGTVTSVAATSVSGDFAITGSPITTSGTLDFALAGVIPISKGGTGLANSTATAQGVVGHTVGANFLGVIPTTGTNSILGANSTHDPYFIAGAVGIGQVLAIDPTATANWSAAPTANGQVFTYVNSTTGAAWTTPAAGGVTSVAATSSDLTITGSPITSSGTLNFALNTVAIGKGGTGQAFTTATPAGVITHVSGASTLNIAALSGTGSVLTSNSSQATWSSNAAITGQVLYFGPSAQGVTWSPNPASNGQVFTYINSATGCAWTTLSGGSGTVTSVGAGSSDGSVAITGSPITTSGNFGLTVNWAGVSSTMRSTGQFAGLTVAPTGNTSYTISSNQVHNDSIIFAQLCVANGGTLDPSDYSNFCTVSARVVNTSFTVQMNHITSISGSNYYIQWLIINS